MVQWGLLLKSLHCTDSEILLQTGINLLKNPGYASNISVILSPKDF